MIELDDIYIILKSYFQVPDTFYFFFLKDILIQDITV